MNRVNLTDGSGRWFNEESALEFHEATWWDGNNHISCDTGSQWHHVSVYYTSTGRFIFCNWSNYANVRSTYKLISEEEALVWIAASKARDDCLAKLPRRLRDAIATLVIETEV